MVKYNFNKTQEKGNLNFLFIFPTMSTIAYLQFGVIIVLFGCLYLLVDRRQKRLLKGYEKIVNERVTRMNIQKEELLLQNNELRKKVALKDKLFYIIAHDLKNPFNSLLGFSKLLEKNYSVWNDEKRLKTIKIICEASINIYSLLDNLLQWSRAQQNVLNCNPLPISIKEVLVSSLRFFSSNIAEKELTIDIKLTEKCEFVYADSQMLNTIFRNLISNAIKFSKPQGRVEIFSELEDAVVKVHFRDFGVGMDKNAKEKIFKTDIYYSTKGTKGEKGTGLGLMLSKEFVERNNGKICVESSPGSGSDFMITLPVVF